MKKIFYISVIGLFLNYSVAFSQSTNADASHSFINISFPKTPESEGIEKYGMTPVNEVTGQPDISIPLYTLKSKFLEVPMTLSYNASGIKVDQEATWVGLGWDLIAGGRITVDVKGNTDGVPRWLTTDYRTGLTNIFNRFNNANSHTILTYATTQWDWNEHLTLSDPDFYKYDDTKTVESMAWFGSGEPDIYHATFAGNSFSFYIDMVTDQIKFIGEKSRCRINAIRDNGSGTPITQWTITDGSGTTYYFSQIETAKFSQPSSNYGVFATDNATTAWLLTKIQHRTGDYILFTYQNYGEINPAYAWSASLSNQPPSNSITQSEDNQQNQFTLYSAYLTKIESQDAEIDFVLANRDDLKGDGAKRLVEIQIRDKQANTIRRKIQFSYGYFGGTLESYHINVPATESKYYQLRLKLNSLFLNDSTLCTPYKFYYNETYVPEKYSFDQDHWGFYNQGNNRGSNYGAASPKNMIPKLSDLNSEGILNVSINLPPGEVFPDGEAHSRKCNPDAMTTMTLNSIVYPTGGSTIFTFGPHQSDYFYPNNTITGGGLRIQKIQNYDLNRRTLGIIKYDYVGGVYQGALNYLTSLINLFPISDLGAEPLPIFMNSMNNSASMNESEMLVAYSQVTKTEIDTLNRTNGKSIKYFYVTQPYEVDLHHSIDVMAAIWPVSFTQYGQTVILQNDIAKAYIDPYYYGLAPTPKMMFDGKLWREQDLDNNNNLIKSTTYNYSQGDYSENLFSIKAKDNFNGGPSFGESIQPGLHYDYDNTSGMRRFTMAISPAKSFFTQLNNVITEIYNSSGIITQTKAFKYNDLSQVEYASDYNSDGTQNVIHTQTLGTFNYPNNKAPFGSLENSLLTLKTYCPDLSLETTKLKRYSNGDTVVLGSSLSQYAYQQPVLEKVFSIEIKNPLKWRTEFKPANYYYDAGEYFTFNSDNHYKLQETAIYDSTVDYHLQQTATKQKITSYLWNYNNSLPTAAAINATSDQIACSSFEADGAGNWTIGSATRLTGDGVTGTQYYQLSNGPITKNGLISGNRYIVSYWTQNASSLTINATTGVKGRTYGIWTYYQHAITLSGTVITIPQVSGTIDELRLYPADAQMTTYTYSPLIGMTSQCDINNKITYYEYDGLSRLKLIRDQDNDIIKKFDYTYYSDPNATAPTACSDQTGGNCAGPGKKCINGFCELGTRVNTGTTLLFNGTWRCHYYYVWSDGSQSADIAETNPVPCDKIQ